MATQSNTQDGSHASERLEQAYREYRAQLRRFFELNSRNREAVDDLMQTMYLQLLNSRPSADVRDPQGYLFRMAWNTLHTANRRARTERAHAVSTNVDSLNLWVEDDTSLTLQQREIEQVLQQLPRVCQVALIRQYRDNRSYKEIAEELGVTVHAVKKYIMRALNHFRMHFNENV